MKIMGPSGDVSGEVPAEAPAEGGNVVESLLTDPTTMKLAFANIALNFLESVAGVEGVATRIASAAP